MSKKPARAGIAAVPVLHRNLIAAAVLSLFAAPAFAAPGDPQDCVEGTGGDTSLICGDPAAGNAATEANAIAIGTGNKANDPKATLIGRSEEHTSELQQILRTTYGDFRMNKKNTII